MVLDDTAWSCWIRYAVLALYTIVDHLHCLCWLSFRLVSLGSQWARLSARLTALFCQCQVLVPPWCFLFPWVFHGDSVVGCFVDEVGDVGDGTEGVLGSLEV